MYMKQVDIKIPAEGYNTAYQSPSNIAIVKYWGKKGEQIPANASLSLTLSECRTETRMVVKPSSVTTDDYDVTVYLDGEKKDDFVPKIKQFFTRIVAYAPYLHHCSIEIHTHNTFPHSSGIASSASGMSALSMCLVDMEKNCGEDMNDTEMKNRASFYARLGSGSASRSIYPVAAVWGQHDEYEHSSDLYAVAVEDVHPVFHTFHDTVLLIEKGQKSVSSTVGHSLMKGHPYSVARYEQAVTNMSKLKDIISRGDIEAFGTLAESEALTLHAMMMTASPYYILFAPRTIEAIQLIWEARKNQGLPVYFTLDAGANVHVLYPDSHKNEVQSFIKEKLSPLCQGGTYINDVVGGGSSKI
jgi:diphosphomevalonate decarboxylase